MTEALLALRGTVRPVRICPGTRADLSGDPCGFVPPV
jgi:hypothetical protein